MKKEYTEMNKEELLKEKAKIDFFLKEPGSTASKPVYDSEEVKIYDTNLNLFYDSLSFVLNKRLHKEPVPLGVIRARGNKTTYKSITELSKNIDIWLDESVGHIKRSERVKMYHLIVELLCKLIESWGMAISVRTIANSKDYFPGVVEKAFPGYIKGGLIKLILSAKIHKYNEEDLT